MKTGWFMFYPSFPEVIKNEFVELKQNRATLLYITVWFCSIQPITVKSSESVTHIP